MLMKDNSLSEAEIIEQAQVFQPDSDDLLQALEAFYGHGFHDDQDGDVETFGHFYRVHRWIVWTDNCGFKELDSYDNEDEAVKAFEQLSKEFAATFDTDECY